MSTSAEIVHPLSWENFENTLFILYIVVENFMKIFKNVCKKFGGILADIEKIMKRVYQWYGVILGMLR